MNTFEIDQLPDVPNHLFIDIDQRFNVVIERIETGLEIRVYPITNGQLWDAPYCTFEVADSEIIELEAQLHDDAVELSPDQSQ